MREDWIETTEEEERWSMPGGCACIVVIVGLLLAFVTIGVAIYVGLS